MADEGGARASAASPDHDEHSTSEEVGFSMPSTPISFFHVCAQRREACVVSWLFLCCAFLFR